MSRLASRAYSTPGSDIIAGGDNRDEVDPGQSYWLGAKGRSLDDVVGMIQGRTRQDKRQWQRFLERLEDYRAFLHGRGYHHLLTDPEGRLIFADSREIGGLRVGIAGFNSARHDYLELFGADLTRAGARWMLLPPKAASQLHTGE